MKKAGKLFAVAAVVFLFQCKSSQNLGTSSPAHLKATVVKEGLVNCFEQGLSANGQPIWCEASAVVYDGSKLFFANDKDMPDKRSSVFYWAFNNGFADTSHNAEYLANPILRAGKKFEDFALTPDGKTVFLTTGFDRVKPDSKEWNAYNTIFYWHVGDEANPHVLRTNNTDSTSVFLRDKISQVLINAEFSKGMPYFKIEGLAATDDLLYFAVREEGKKYDDFKYKIKILTVSYKSLNGNVALGDNFKVFADINLTDIEPSLKEPMGISSIEYDHYNKRFLILTSFESGGKLGGYLWSATRKELGNNHMSLVLDTNGKPIRFNNKAEDIAVISKKRIIVVHDDDRMTLTVGGKVRQPNQAAYSVVEF